MINHSPDPANNNEPAKILGTTIANQHRASNPDNSAWVSANAGSGKTFVLAQRVIRLLLNNIPPSRILCLTFTKAAAAEMSNRVFSQLSNWSALDDQQLEIELKKNGELHPGTAMMKTARLLFTRALESPGGLKIQTIHAFCESLLHQFTLEANTSGHFEVMGEYQQTRLLQESRQAVMASTLEDPALAGALEAAMKFGSDRAIENGLNAIIRNRQDFQDWLKDHDTNPDKAITVLGEFLGTDMAESEESRASRLLSGLPIDELRLRELGITAGHLDIAECRRLSTLINEYTSSQSSIQKLETRFRLYQTAKGGFRKKIPGTKALYEEVAGIKELLEEEFESIKAACDEILNWKMLNGSLGLFILANAVLNIYGQRKRARGILDFDDLVNRAADLLARSDVRQWVQYKLDQGIDHVLVDEAQDTSAVQWQIVNAIIEDFFSGQSAQKSGRTIFAVGDQKQSIYSFQGANPEMFTRQKVDLNNKAQAVSSPFEDIKLPISFRSTHDILSAVDMVFENPANAKGLQATDDGVIHEPVRETDPGEVLIWPMIEHEKTGKQEDWLLPVDHIGEDHPTQQLARRIAQTIRNWIDKGASLPGKGRKITHGDVLILVRKRDRFASSITRELKQAGLSVAGADRLNLTSHIAIEDLLSFGKWALFPEDDLSLAEMLKSPIFDFDEEELFLLCMNRDKKSLWQSLCEEAREANTGKLVRTRNELARLLSLVDTLPTFEFYSEILSTHSGRMRFKARLGDEVDDVLDAFMLEALNHATNGGIGLQDFIHGLETSAPDIKRELDLQKDEIRVMTVHSAKGLEAPIVFLVDPGAPAYSSHHRPSILKVDYHTTHPAFLWQPGKDDGSELTAAILTQFQEKAEEEYRRLLYVAMTRAEDKLIICGYANRNTGSASTWHQMVRDSLIEECEEITQDGEVAAWRWTKKQPRRKPRKEVISESKLDTTMDSLPDWAVRTSNNEADIAPPLFPSTAALSVETSPREQDLASGGIMPAGDNFAIEKGNATHHLLQLLPSLKADQRRERAGNYLDRSFPDWKSEQRQQILREVMAILEDNRFADLFTDQSQAEVSLAGILDPDGLNRRINAQIDRIAILENTVVIVDYKSDRHIPSLPEKISSRYLVQLAIYRELVAQIFEGKQVKCSLVWTSGPQIIDIPDELLSSHLNAWLDAAKHSRVKGQTDA